MISLCLLVLQPSYISDGLHMLPCLLLYQTHVNIPYIAVKCYNNLDLQITHSSELRFVSSSDSSLLWCHLLKSVASSHYEYVTDSSCIQVSSAQFQSSQQIQEGDTLAKLITISLPHMYSWYTLSIIMVSIIGF